ncbi:MAG TPA: hypothetical protein DCR14_15865, partial [Acidimicrobiaceae bacterium]|nr:hypothetical protein [Acidimicrobiaceae bacterium]
GGGAVGEAVEHVGGHQHRGQAVRAGLARGQRGRGEEACGEIVHEVLGGSEARGGAGVEGAWWDAIEGVVAGVEQVLGADVELEDVAEAPRDAGAQVEPRGGLDHRAGEVAVHGWTEGSGVQLADALGWFPTAAAFVITDIARDGMLGGPDLVGLAEAGRSTSIPVIASGGVSSLADLRALQSVPGVDGVITGKALYEGRFTVAEALAVLAR